MIQALAASSLSFFGPFLVAPTTDHQTSLPERSSSLIREWWAQKEITGNFGVQTGQLSKRPPQPIGATEDVRRFVAPGLPVETRVQGLFLWLPLDMRRLGPKQIPLPTMTEGNKSCLFKRTVVVVTVVSCQLHWAGLHALPLCGVLQHRPLVADSKQASFRRGELCRGS